MTRGSGKGYIAKERKIGKCKNLEKKTADQDLERLASYIFIRKATKEEGLCCPATA